jgi:hypothetical protein
MSEYSDYTNMDLAKRFGVDTEGALFSLAARPAWREREQRAYAVPYISYAVS